LHVNRGIRFLPTRGSYLVIFSLAGTAFFGPVLHLVCCFVVFPRRRMGWCQAPRRLIFGLVWRERVPYSELSLVAIFTTFTPPSPMNFEDEAWPLGACGDRLRFLTCCSTDFQDLWNRVISGLITASSISCWALVRSFASLNCSLLYDTWAAMTRNVR
jgi:hypothetical protein